MLPAVREERKRGKKARRRGREKVKLNSNELIYSFSLKKVSSTTHSALLAQYVGSRLDGRNSSTAGSKKVT